MTIVLIAGILIYLSTGSGNYEVRRSLLVKADRQTLFDQIRDFRSWPGTAQ